MRIAFVRPPALPAYHDIDIKEDPMLCALNGYFEAIDFPAENLHFFDFQLDKNIRYESLLDKPYDYYVLAARDVGESYRYSLRLAELLSQDTSADIILYGQVAPLRHMQDLPPRTHICNQAEAELARLIGVSDEGPHFSSDLQYASYYSYLKLEPWQEKRMKGGIETSRGCPYKCKFCFISVGDSYEKRWQMRNNDAIIRDLKSYIAKGITTFVFLDSEFLGANPKQHEMRAELLERIINELPPIKYMTLCRADTLQKFNRFDLLKKSGMWKVLVGVESLYQPDLDYLRKDSSVEIMLSSINQLIEHKIECCLTYITFNQNTSVEGLSANLDQIEKLYQHPEHKYLGMPNFSFNMEIVRGDSDNLEMQSFNDSTYIQPLLEARGQQKSDQACFDNRFEPLIEMYRLLQYEWVVKKCELIREKVNADEDTRAAITQWFSGLGMFCIRVMRHYLRVFEQGELSLQSIREKHRDELFDFFREYNISLPEALQDMSTQEHAMTLDYESKYDMSDHGWDTIIPPSAQERQRLNEQAVELA